VIIAGLTARTNAQGAAGLQQVFPAVPVVTVDVARLTATARKQAVLSHHGEGSVEEVLHLKSFCSMCTEKSILVGGKLGSALQEELGKNPLISAQHDFIHVPDMAAANCVLVNSTLLRRTRGEFPASDAVLNALLPRRIRQVEVAGGELAKVDGALSCCSLLF
jgi:N-dimethylarginine dimethylaminohydrolase